MKEKTKLKGKMKFPILSLLLAGSALAAGAQTHYSSNVSIGVKAGADLSRVSFYPSIRQSMQPGALAGVTFRYIEENHFGLIAELNFVQRGWKENFEDEPYRYSRTLNYLELPVLAHIYFGRRGRFFFNAGPQIGYLLGESTSANFDPDDIKNIAGFPSNRQNAQLSMPVHNRFDYGISAGLGGEFNIDRVNSLSLEARFYLGLGNIMSSKRVDIYSASNSMTVSISAGYWFRFK